MLSFGVFGTVLVTIFFIVQYLYDNFPPVRSEVVCLINLWENGGEAP